MTATWYLPFMSNGESRSSTCLQTSHWDCKGDTVHGTSGTWQLLQWKFGAPFWDSLIFSDSCVRRLGHQTLAFKAVLQPPKSQKRYQGRKSIVRWIACGAQDWIFSDRWAWWWNCGNWPGWQEVWWTLATLLVTSDSGEWYSFSRSDILFRHLDPYRRVLARKRERERETSKRGHQPFFQVACFGASYWYIEQPPPSSM